MQHAVCTILFCLLMLPGPACAAAGNASNRIRHIHIVTPAWKNQTHADGTGLFFEILRRVYEPEGIRMEFEIVPWKRAHAMIDANQADARLAIIRTSPDQWMPRYPLYVDYTVAVFRPETIQQWKGRESLDGKRAVTMRGYQLWDLSYFDGLRLDWSEVNTHEQAWKMLDSGRVDVYLDALIDVEPYIHEHQVDRRRYRLEVLYGRNAYVEFAHSERSERLMAIYERRIVELQESGELEALFRKWGVRFTPFVPEPAD